MDFFLTIDVETYTGDYDTDVFAGGQGLGLILKTCRDFNFPATFFVEAMGGTRWGNEGLKRVCGMIREAGQEVQLHVHPIVATLDGFHASDDALWHFDVTTQRRLIETGRDILLACGVPSITAFRAGDLAANGDTLRAMESLGLGIGSNRDLDTKSSIRSRINDIFPVVNDLSRSGKVLDVPVTCFRSALPAFDGPWRHFQITALSVREMTTALREMNVAGYRAVTVLTHPGEFFQRHKGRLVPKRKNIHRLQRLLHVARELPSIRPQFVSAAANSVLPDRSPSDIRLRMAHSVRRIGMQVMARMVPGL